VAESVIPNKYLTSAEVKNTWIYTSTPRLYCTFFCSCLETVDCFRIFNAERLLSSHWLAPDLALLMEHWVRHAENTASVAERTLLDNCCVATGSIIPFLLQTAVGSVARQRLDKDIISATAVRSRNNMLAAESAFATRSCSRVPSPYQTTDEDSSVRKGSVCCSELQSIWISDSAIVTCSYTQ
jgi:hypothetical protein